MSEKTQHWNSRIGIILAVMGSAIGLGNFLRFPGLAARYGGGSFFIPYIIAFFILGLPIAWAEWSIGRTGGLKGYHSSPGIFRVLWKNRFSPYLGSLGLLIPVGIFMYYIFIEAWCLYYASQYLLGSLELGNNSQAYQSFFNNFVGMEADGILWKNGVSSAVIAVLFCYALNFFIIYKGLNRGIELVSKIAIPLLFVSSFIILIKVLSLDTPNPSFPSRNLNNALGSMWNPNVEQGFFHSLLNAEMWLAAAGQIFFSLSVGFGVIINYSSYLRKKDDVLLSASTAASGNIFAEIVLGGMITIPAAFLFLGNSGISDSTFSLGFTSLPNVFAHMPWGRGVGFLWFFLLFLAALTSSISMLQPALAFFEEGLKFKKAKALLVLFLLTLTGTIFIIYFSKSARALDMIDFWIGTACIYVFAMILVLLFSWGIGAKQGLKEAEQGSLIRIPKIFCLYTKICISFVFTYHLFFLDI